MAMELCRETCSKTLDPIRISCLALDSPDEMSDLVVEHTKSSSRQSRKCQIVTVFVELISTLTEEATCIDVPRAISVPCKMRTCQL